MDYFESESRRYSSQRGSSLGASGQISPVIKYLIIINLIVFFMDSILSMFFGIQLSGIFGLIPFRIIHNLFVWQIFTYMFFHGGLFHIFWNLLALWMFGVEVERTLGSRIFCVYYLTAGMVAGICSVLFNFNSLIPTIGASGAIFGVLAAFGMLFPEREITLLLFLVIPVRAKAKYIVLGFGILTFFQTTFLPESNISHIAHLGGLLFGVLYFKDILYIQSFLGRFASKIKISNPITKLKRKQPIISQDTYISDEIDPILDKISREGIHSLTRQERKLLDKARNKL